MPKLTAVRLCAAVVLLSQRHRDSRRVSVDGGGFAGRDIASGWSQGKLIDPLHGGGGGLNSVSCPTASFCITVDRMGDFLTYNGSSWSSPDEIDQNGLYSVSARQRAFAPRWTAKAMPSPTKAARGRRRQHRPEGRRSSLRLFALRRASASRWIKAATSSPTTAARGQSRQHRRGGNDLDSVSCRR